MVTQQLSRAERRRFSKDLQKRVSKMSINEFDTTLNQVVYSTQDEVMRAVKQALSSELGVGDKRYERVKKEVFRLLNKWNGGE